MYFLEIFHLCLTQTEKSSRTDKGLSGLGGFPLRHTSPKPGLPTEILLRLRGFQKLTEVIG